MLITELIRVDCVAPPVIHVDPLFAFENSLEFGLRENGKVLLRNDFKDAVEQVIETVLVVIEEIVFDHEFRILSHILTGHTSIASVWNQVDLFHLVGVGDVNRKVQSQVRIL